MKPSSSPSAPPHPPFLLNNPYVIATLVLVLILPPSSFYSLPNPFEPMSFTTKSPEHSSQTPFPHPDIPYPSLQATTATTSLPVSEPNFGPKQFLGACCSVDVNANDKWQGAESFSGHLAGGERGWKERRGLGGV
eukprot:44030-Amorphochlora_amoeboformis.AAC.1